MQFTNPASLTGPISVSGGTIDSVTNPVSTDPASTIAVVSTSVPFLNKDSFFWPAMAGEPYPPTLSSSSYSSSNGWPAYRNNTSTGAFVQSPILPRIGFNGKTTLTLTGKVAYTTTAGTAGSTLSRVGFNTSGGSLNFGYLQLVATTAAAGAPYTISLITPSGTYALPGNYASGILHDFSIVINAAGLITATVDGNTVNSVAGDWPSSVTVTTPFWRMDTVGAATSSKAELVAPAIAWT